MKQFAVFYKSVYLCVSVCKLDKAHRVVLGTHWIAAQVNKASRLICVASRVQKDADRSVYRTIDRPLLRVSLLACNNYNYKYLCVLAGCVYLVRCATLNSCTNFSAGLGQVTKAWHNFQFNYLQYQYRYTAKKTQRISCSSISLFVFLTQFSISFFYSFTFTI